MKETEDKQKILEEVNGKKKKNENLIWKEEG